MENIDGSNGGYSDFGEGEWSDMGEGAGQPGGLENDDSYDEQAREDLANLTGELAAYGATLPEEDAPFGNEMPFEDETAEAPTNTVIITNSGKRGWGKRGGYSSEITVTSSTPEGGQIIVGPGSKVLGADGQPLKDKDLPQGVQRVGRGAVIRMNRHEDGTPDVHITDPVGAIRRFLRRGTKRDSGDKPENS